MVAKLLLWLVGVLSSLSFWFEGVMNPPVCECCGRQSHSVHAVESYRYEGDDQFSVIYICHKCSK